MGRVELVLPAMIPADELDRLDAVSGTILADQVQVREFHPELVFGRVDVDLLPGMRLAGPGRQRWGGHPRTAPAFVNIDALLPVALVRLDHQRRQGARFT